MKDKDELLTLTPQQQNPYLARPEHFAITTSVGAATATVPLHGQHGQSEHQKRNLMKRADSRGKTPLTGAGQQLNPAASKAASAPHTPGFSKKS